MLKSIKPGLLCGVLLWLLLPALPLSAQPETDNEVLQIGLRDYVETLYDESNGMITSEANAVLQDREGYIWIGSYGGLARYNGQVFENMSQLREGTPSSGVRALLEDSRGRIWIGTNDGGVYLFENQTFSQAVAGPLSVRCMAEGEDGTVYVGTTEGLLCIRDDPGRDVPRLISFFQDSRMEGQTVEDLICAQDGAMWCVTANGYIFRLWEGQVQLALDQDFLDTTPTYGLCQARSGAIYLGTTEGYVLCLTVKSETPSPGDIQVEYLSLGSALTINDIYQDSRENLWVCTDNGLGYFDPSGTFYKINSASSNTIITQMCEDYEGNLWFASSRRGFIKLAKSKFTNISFDADLSGQTVNSTLFYQGNLYIGTDIGLAIVDEEGSKILNDLTELLRDVRIRSLMKDGEGNMWISTYREYGLLKYRGETGEWTSYTTQTGMPHDQVRMALALSNGDIAAATNGGVAILRDGKVVDIYNAQDGISNEVILCLTETRDGHLLAGSDGSGIYDIDLAAGRMVRNITPQDGLQSGVILRMVPDAKGEGLWISNGSDLAFWTEDGIAQVPYVNAGIGSVFDIKVTDEYIWLLKSFGLIRITRDNLLVGVSDFEVLVRKDGLTNSITANSWNDMTDSGRLYVSTGNGVYYFDTEDIYRNTTAPRISINYLDVDGKLSYGLQDVSVGSDCQRITVWPDLLSFGLAGGTFEYYLEGFDKAPVQLKNTAGAHISYTNLNGGDYTFHLLGYNADGTVSDELTFRLHKEASPFEKRYAFIWIFFGVLLLAMACVLIYQTVKKKQVLRRQKAYKDMTYQTVRIIAKAIDAKDKYTIGHSNRVASYSVEIGRRYGLNADQLEQLYYTAQLHDIGKIGVPDQILNKAGKLTPEEYEAIKRHPSIGGDILADFTQLPWIAEGARYHHERYDGTGYNAGIKGEEIPLYARIISVADAYDAMNSSRVYRPSMNPEVIYHELEHGCGSQFDPAFAKIMMQMMKDGFEAKEENPMGNP